MRYVSLLSIVLLRTVASVKRSSSQLLPFQNQEYPDLNLKKPFEGQNRNLEDLDGETNPEDLEDVHHGLSIVWILWELLDVFTEVPYCRGNTESGFTTVGVWKILEWFQVLTNPNDRKGQCGEFCAALCNHQPCFPDFYSIDPDLCSCINTVSNCGANTQCDLLSEQCFCTNGFGGDPLVGCVPPTQAPTPKPTPAPAKAPTKAPTSAPAKAPTKAPTSAPTSGKIGWRKLLVWFHSTITSLSHLFLCFHSNKLVPVPAPPAITCSGYFCDKFLDTMHIIMTHNSLAGLRVVSPNQNQDLADQFRAGIRGFNLDLYGNMADIFFTAHPAGTLSYDPRPEINALIDELRKPEHVNEFIVVQLEDNLETQEGINESSAVWGDLLIKDFDIKLPLSTYIEKGQRVLLVTDQSDHKNTADGRHVSQDLITENNFEWKLCFDGRIPLEFRRGPRTGRYGTLMSSFCSLTSSGDIVASSNVNGKQKLLFNSRFYMKADYAQ